MGKSFVSILARDHSNDFRMVNNYKIANASQAFECLACASDAFEQTKAMELTTVDNEVPKASQPFHARLRMAWATHLHAFARCSLYASQSFEIRAKYVS